MAPRRGGFTVLELVVVLAILSLLVALVAPAAVRGIDAWRTRLAADDLRQQFARLPTLVRRAGVGLDHAEGDPWPESLPPPAVEGAILRFEQPLVVRSNGYCESGRVSVAIGGARREYLVRPPTCTLEAVDAGAAR